MMHMKHYISTIDVCHFFINRDIPFSCLAGVSIQCILDTHGFSQFSVDFYTLLSLTLNTKYVAIV